MSINPFSKVASKASETPQTAASAPVRLVQALFSKQLRFKREDGGHKVMLEGTGKVAQGDTAAHASVDLHAAASMNPKSAAPAAAMACLAELLDSAPGSRKTFRHLAAVESALKRINPDGLFLFDMSAANLKQALRQLDGLWTEPAPPGLESLRAKMRDALAAQERRQVEQPQARGSFNVPSSFLVDEKMQVSEGSASDFQRLSDSYAESKPTPTER